MAEVIAAGGRDAGGLGVAVKGGAAQGGQGGGVVVGVGGGDGGEGGVDCFPGLEGGVWRGLFSVGRGREGGKGFPWAVLGGDLEEWEKEWEMWGELTRMRLLLGAFVFGGGRNLRS